jgi:hypothetical protein
MTIAAIAIFFLGWLALGGVAAILVCPLMNHVACGCRLADLQRAGRPVA